MNPGDLVRVKERCSVHSYSKSNSTGAGFFFAEKDTIAILIGLDLRYDHWRNNNRYEILLNGEISTIDIGFLEIVNSAKMSQ